VSDDDDDIDSDAVTKNDLAPRTQAFVEETASLCDENGYTTAIDALGESLWESKVEEAVDEGNCTEDDADPQVLDTIVETEVDGR
jgi:hypothetical protein